MSKPDQQELVQQENEEINNHNVKIVWVLSLLVSAKPFPKQEEEKGEKRFVFKFEFQIYLQSENFLKKNQFLASKIRFQSSRNVVLPFNQISKISFCVFSRSRSNSPRQTPCLDVVLLRHFRHRFTCRDVAVQLVWDDNHIFRVDNIFLDPTTFAGKQKTGKTVKKKKTN